MTTNSGFVVDCRRLPENFPTHLHDAAFWEWLGRVIATFGFLEEVLGKAIFAFSATRPYPENEIHAAYEKWKTTLELALYDPLGNLISSYEKAVREHEGANIENFPELVIDLQRAAELRNVMCHGSWRKPDANGGSLPLFVNRRMKVFDTKIDVAFLQQTQRHVAGLACAVISSVTSMGWQFPGSDSPGNPLIPTSQPKSQIPNPKSLS
ncbi:MAG: hypothetical protein ACOZAA_11690 [Pseudomonadota bacterium]